MQVLYLQSSALFATVYFRGVGGQHQLVKAFLRLTNAASGLTGE